MMTNFEILDFDLNYLMDNDHLLERSNFLNFDLERSILHGYPVYIMTVKKQREMNRQMESLAMIDELFRM